MTLTGLTQTTYNLDPNPIGSGGEGDIYRVLGEGSKVVKIYKSGALTPELEEKLKIMIEHPPNASVLSQVAWPLDLVRDGSGNAVGFVMSELSINAELGEVYKYPATLPISTQQKIKIAQNICVVISEVHAAGYIFGDFNPRNIGLDTNTGRVSFLDTDTYHVVDYTKDTVYRCNVCAAGYAAPELLEKCSEYVAANPSASSNAYAQTPLPTFTKKTDNFALAIHIFKLLMNGYTPFGGIIETASVSQASPGVGDAAVRRNSYCFRPGYKHQSAAILPLEALPEEIADLFTRAFIIGKSVPQQRPDAVEWHGALARFEQQLVTCPHNPLHQYDKKNTECPLCEADENFGAVLAEAATPSLKQTSYTPPPEAAQPVCPKCFVNVVAGSKFCGGCGFGFTASQAQTTAATPAQTQTAQAFVPTPAQKKAARFVVAVIGGLFLVAAIVHFSGGGFIQPAPAPAPPAPVEQSPAPAAPTPPPATPSPPRQETPRAAPTPPRQTPRPAQATPPAEPTPAQQSPTPIATYATTANLNLRAAPSTQAQSLGVIPGGTYVQVVEYVNSEWYRVIHEDQTGYMAAEYLRRAGTAGAVPQTPAPPAPEAPAAMPETPAPAMGGLPETPGPELGLPMSPAPEVPAPPTQQQGGGTVWTPSGAQYSISTPSRGQLFPGDVLELTVSTSDPSIPFTVSWSRPQSNRWWSFRDGRLEVHYYFGPNTPPLRASVTVLEAGNPVTEISVNMNFGTR